MLIDWFTVGAQVVNFLILVALLKKFLYGPIVRVMEERESRIAGGLKEAAEQKKEAQQEAELYREKSLEFEEKRAAMIAQAAEEAEVQRKELMQQARREVDEKRAAWSQSLEREKQAFLQDLRDVVGSGVVAISRRALADLADVELERQVLEVFVARIRAMSTKADKDLLGTFLHSAETLLVASAFEIPAQWRGEIVEVVRERLDLDREVHFQVVPDLLCGIELRAGGYKLSWSIGDYLDTLEESLARAFEQGSVADGSDRLAPVHEAAGGGDAEQDPGAARSEAMQASVGDSEIDETNQ